MKRGDKIKEVITIAKVKRGVPTVVLIAGHRYVLDPNNTTEEAKQRETTPTDTHK